MVVRYLAITVASQSLHTSTPSTSYLFTHHLSLLKHHSAATRRESLSYLKSHLPDVITQTPLGSGKPDGGAIPTISVVVATLVPLMLDSSQSVRAQLLALLKSLPAPQVAMYSSKILMFVNSAMTHISEEVRADSTKFLEWAVDLDRENTFGGGRWGVSLRGIVGCLGWGGLDGDGSRAIVPKTKDAKVMMQHLGVLKRVLEVGLSEQDECAAGEERRTAGPVLHVSSELHSVPNRSDVYAYLCLFSASNSGGSCGQTGDTGLVEPMGEPEDRGSRLRYLLHGPGKPILSALEMGLMRLKKDGGEVGRVSGKTLAVLGDLLEKKEAE